MRESYGNGYQKFTGDGETYLGIVYLDETADVVRRNDYLYLRCGL